MGLGAFASHSHGTERTNRTRTETQTRQNVIVIGDRHERAYYLPRLSLCLMRLFLFRNSSLSNWQIVRMTRETCDWACSIPVQYDLESGWRDLLREFRSKWFWLSTNSRPSLMSLSITKEFLLLSPVHFVEHVEIRSCSAMIHSQRSQQLIQYM